MKPTPYDHMEFMETLQHNCDISDASGAAIFSICGMALRLRDLNKWEAGLHAWEENDPSLLLDWIDRKEKLWDTLDENNFLPLPLFGESFDPFDTTDINGQLASSRLFYGAGYAHSLKPTFLLAKIEQTKKIDGIPVVLLGKELVRDLLTIPAFNQDKAVIIRRDAARFFLWDQMAYLKKSGQRFLDFALRQCGLPDPGVENRKKRLPAILSAQEQTYIYHEIGELTDTVFDHDTFAQIVSQFPRTAVELLARTVKDLLADTGPHGTLSHIISTRNTAALGFYAAFQDGLFKPLFPELRPAVEQFVSSKTWDSIEKVRQEGFARARTYARNLVELFSQPRFRDHPDQFADKVDTALIRPLLGR